MGTPYIGEIRLFAGNFAPLGWAFCDGALLAIADNDVLFQLIGTTYGGDGQNTFAVPDLRGRLPVHMGTQGGTPYVLGQLGGAATVTLGVSQMPAHSHAVMADVQPGTHTAPAGRVMAGSEDDRYGAADGTAMASAAVALTGGGQAHDNLMPSMGLSFIISLFGIFPSP